MVALIEAVTVSGRMVQAVLSIDAREKMTEVGKRNFIVPKLELMNTPMELAGGASTLAIEGGTPVEPPTLQLNRGSDDEIVEAEILTDEQLAIETRLKEDALQFGFDEHAYLAAVRAQVNDDWDRMLECSKKVRGGVIEPTQLSHGRLTWATLIKT